MAKNKTLIDLEKEISSFPTKVVIDGSSLTLQDILAVARQNATVAFTTDKTKLKRIKTSYEMMMSDIKNGVPVYGCNTGYGARASHVRTNGTEEERLAIGKEFSDGIVHVDVSVGPLFPKEVVRAAMLIRINMLMQGVSAVKIEDLEIYRRMLNEDITPLVNQYGGIGASGDLAHNGRVLSAARQLPGIKVIDKNGKVQNAKDALSKANIPPLVLDPKAGLGLVNGDNFSTALAALLWYDTLQAILISTVTHAMMIEALKGTDRSFHPLLDEVRSHPGQKEAAAVYRYLLSGSKLAFQEMKGHIKRDPGIKVQDAYSLRCLSQYMAVNFEKMKQTLETILINANSVSDNPLWAPEEHTTKDEKPWQWVSGGNFIAMHMVEVIDSLRKIMTQVVKVNDRHLARLINPHDNNGLSPNLSDEEAITQCTFKGVQIQSGMFDVYATLLSFPISTLFGVHEENNQDITSHALTSGILGMENLRIMRYSLSQNLVALAQAIDIRGGEEKLSQKTKPVYKFLRTKVSYVAKERPLYGDIEEVYKEIITGGLIRIVRNKVFADM